MKTVPTEMTTVLLISADEEQLAATAECLNTLFSGDAELHVATTILEAYRMLKEQEYDMVLADMAANRDSVSTTYLLSYVAPDTPTLLITGMPDGGATVLVRKAGLKELIIKGRMSKTVLGRAIRRMATKSANG